MENEHEKCNAHPEDCKGCQLCDGLSESTEDSGYNTRLSMAIEYVLRELDKTTEEELHNEINKYKDDPRALAILYSLDSTML
jgi:hypothetical protein